MTGCLLVCVFAETMDLGAGSGTGLQAERRESEQKLSVSLGGKRYLLNLQVPTALCTVEIEVFARLSQ